MANNLKNTEATQFQSGSEAVEAGQRGGIASGEARRRKRDIRLALEALLEKDITDKKGNVMTTTEAIALKQIEKALKGDTKAFEVVRDTVGQKPTEKVDLSIEDESARAIDDYFAEKYNRPTGK